MASRNHELGEILKRDGLLPALDLICEGRQQIEAFTAQIGLKLMRAIMDQEIDQRCGPWGQQSHYRHGSQPGYVIYDGRKVATPRPRLRSKQGVEAELASYQAFQQNGKMQQAVARQLIRRVSCRDYATAINDCLEGYGISRSSVSRHWQMATQQQLQEICQKPVPENLVALLIDGKHFQKQLVVVALGVDLQGNKHVLGLWHGATENSTVVKSLLVDLRERGLNTEAALLVVLDGSKALHKAVRELFGDLALIQRCRVHKLRNVMEQLQPEKQQQLKWRLRAAWGKPTAVAALEALRGVVRWLRGFNASAASSLEEGMEETVTLQRLGVNELLARSLATTNLIESCFCHVGQRTQRVNRWRGQAMVLRWAAMALRVAEKGFNRIKGYEHLQPLRVALNAHTTKTLAQIRQAA